MRSLLLIALLTLASVSLIPANAVEPDEVLDDPALEARARAISRELRCVVCQSENIDDSNAPLAKDLRILVRERLLAGDSDDAVVDFVVARYGEYVLLKPRLSGRTAFLWAAPAAVILGGGFALWVVVRTRRNGADSDAAPTGAEPLSAAEKREIEKLGG
ncbi:MAG: cytochrome c-type biogenesis protein [Pseudomonadota bacterium]